MIEKRVQRRLAAILAADVVGYSRLMERDETGTIARLKALRRDIVDPEIAAHAGRIVKLMGDGALVEFASAVDAVTCAIEIQNKVRDHNVDVPEDEQIRFRIGINVGDIVVEGDDIYGDGVNIAARIEGLAEPGGVYISRAAAEQVRDKVPIRIEDRGDHSVKNIARPIQVFCVVIEGGMPAPPPPSPPAVTAQPRKPSIAVLPFTNMSGDAEQEYFADGMVDDIITALSRFDQLFVIARNSSFTYKGKAVDVRQVARELGVRYVLEGGVRKAGIRVRITGQLVDAETGAQLWADRFDGDLEDVFGLQDKVTESVIGAIEPTVRKAEMERARRKPAANLDAYDLYLRALPHVHALRPDENLVGLELLKRALALDPSYAAALAHAAWCYEQRVVRGWPAASDDDVGNAISLARRAVSTGSDDAAAQVLAGFVLVMVARDVHAGLDAVGRALRYNAGSGWVALMASLSMVYGGDPEEAVHHAQRAMTLNPLDPAFFIYLIAAAMAHLFCGRPEQALEFARRSHALYTEWDSTYWILIAAYVRLGRVDEAKAALAKFRMLAPTMTVSELGRRLPVRNPASLAIILDGFRAAGLPE